MLGQTLRQIGCLKCGVCDRLMIDDRMADAVAMLTIFGSVPDAYAVCPVCAAELTPDEQTDPTIQHRIRLALVARGRVVHYDVTGRAATRRRLTP